MKKLLSAGAGIILVSSALVLRALFATGDFDLVTAVCELRQTPDDGGRPVFYSQQIRALRLKGDAGFLLADGGRVLADGGALEREYPGLAGGLWIVPDALIDDDSTPIDCVEIADDATQDAGTRQLISGLCACSPFLPDGGHPALCRWDLTPDGGMQKAPGGLLLPDGGWELGRTLPAGHWQGLCVPKVCVVLDGDQSRDVPPACAGP